MPVTTIAAAGIGIRMKVYACPLMVIDVRPWYAVKSDDITIPMYYDCRHTLFPLKGTSLALDDELLSSAKRRFKTEYIDMYVVSEDFFFGLLTEEDKKLEFKFNAS